MEAAQHGMAHGGAGKAVDGVVGAHGGAADGGRGRSARNGADRRAAAERRRNSWPTWRRSGGATPRGRREGSRSGACSPTAWA
uniref:Uncharacterized protein n=1 Tax=Oryza glumipatula TaxID=40148 RepID=A0A0D9ZIK7_9ORYZ